MKIDEWQAVAFNDAAFLSAPGSRHIVDHKINTDEGIVKDAGDFQEEFRIIRMNIGYFRG